jgi:hypothetical protein
MPFNDETKFSAWVEEAVLNGLYAGIGIAEIEGRTGFDREVVECIAERYIRGYYTDWCRQQWKYLCRNNKDPVKIIGEALMKVREVSKLHCKDGIEHNRFIIKSIVENVRSRLLQETQATLRP